MRMNEAALIVVDAWTESVQLETPPHHLILEDHADRILAPFVQLFRGQGGIVFHTFAPGESRIAIDQEDVVLGQNENLDRLRSTGRFLLYAGYALNACVPMKANHGALIAHREGLPSAIVEEITLRCSEDPSYSYCSEEELAKIPRIHLWEIEP